MEGAGGEGVGSLSAENVDGGAFLVMVSWRERNRHRVAVSELKGLACGD